MSPCTDWMQDARLLFWVSQTAWEQLPHSHACETERSMTILKEGPLLFFLQGTTGPDPTTVYVDMRALRHDRYCPCPVCTVHLCSVTKGYKLGLPKLYLQHPVW